MITALLTLYIFGSGAVWGFTLGENDHDGYKWYDILAAVAAWPILLIAAAGAVLLEAVGLTRFGGGRGL